MEVEFLGGAREIGRSALLVDDSLLLDFGMETSNPPRYPVGDVDPEAVVVTHGHLDHVGAIPSLLSGEARPAIHWTPPTYELAQALAPYWLPDASKIQVRASGSWGVSTWRFGLATRYASAGVSSWGATRWRATWVSPDSERDPAPRTLCGELLDDNTEYYKNMVFDILNIIL